MNRLWIWVDYNISAGTFNFCQQAIGHRLDGASPKNFKSFLKNSSDTPLMKISSRGMEIFDVFFNNSKIHKKFTANEMFFIHYRDWPEMVCSWISLGCLPQRLCHSQSFYSLFMDWFPCMVFYLPTCVLCRAKHIKGSSSNHHSRSRLLQLLGHRPPDTKRPIYWSSWDAMESIFTLKIIHYFRCKIWTARTYLLVYWPI